MPICDTCVNDGDCAIQRETEDDIEGCDYYEDNDSGECEGEFDGDDDDIEAIDDLDGEDDLP